ncbi:hypothetical protein [Acinetobacter baumannii]|uniref:hypothetical protein n=1 Tax=Acinetobacter calcoaceticus/baumannii complex TaxID=909768 RepID=UPI001CA7D778|nr:hypothetical protein H2787_18275 [Acinetobacter baumannii]HEO1828337.1 hypothetical protein [Acinetobacter baumannii]
MIYYNVKTESYLADILARVGYGAEFYLHFEIELSKAESLIEKWSQRYNLNQSASLRNQRLNRGIWALDLVVLQNRTLFNENRIKLCLLVTPAKLERFDFKSQNNVNHFDRSKHASAVINEQYAKDLAQCESFYSIHDRKKRLIFTSKHSYQPRTNQSDVQPDPKTSVLSVYELVLLPYSIEERKKAIKGQSAQNSAIYNKTMGFTWRLHKDYLDFKEKSLKKAFTKAQKIKGRKPSIPRSELFPKLKQALAKETDFLSKLAGFRGVRKQVFELNKTMFSLSHKFLDLPLSDVGVELRIPPYIWKQKRLVSSFEEMKEFHNIYK